MPLEPVTTEVIRATFIAAAERMRITMIRTAYNIVISESLDFGCAIFDGDIQMIAQGVGLPIFQGHLGFPIEATVRARGRDSINPGDIYLHNDPYSGNGNHLNDVAMFSPVFWEDSLVGWVAVKAHLVDVGGSVAGSILIDSTDFRQEGLRFQALKICDRGSLNEEILRLLASNIRVGTNALRDLEAMMAVCRTGESYFKEILEKYGASTVAEATRTYLDQSEKRTRNELQKIPAGTYHATAYLDNDGISLNEPVKIEVHVTVADGEITFDCTGSSPQLKGPFNCGDAITISACRLLLKYFTSPAEPADEGCFRPLRVIIPPASVLSVQEPAPTSRYYVPTNLVIELGIQALAAALPDRVPAGSFGDQMSTILTGQNPLTGKYFVTGDINCGGAGGRPQYDGESGLAIYGGAAAQNNPVEVFESRNPFIQISKYGLRQDSGGAGKFRGGLGVERVYQFDSPIFGIFALEREVSPPMGLRGGHDGAVNEIVVTNSAGATRKVRKATRYPIAAGETAAFRTGGGGGFGSPAERDPQAVLNDVADGYISEKAAREVYGLKGPLKPNVTPSRSR
jgi:N-methylhydantoinase B